jgi:hypothetical protein
VKLAIFKEVIDMKPYSMDLWERVLKDGGAGQTGRGRLLMLPWCCIACSGGSITRGIGFGAVRCPSRAVAISVEVLVRAGVLLGDP